MKKISVVGVFCLFSLSLFSQNYFDLSYINSSKNFSEYSFSYLHALSTKIAGGVGYTRYDGKDDTSLSRLLLNYFSRGFSVALTPFYFLKEKDFSFYGIKTSFDVIRYGEETVSRYSFYSSYGKEKTSFKKDVFFAGFIFDKNYYDEFFIMFHGGVGISGSGKFGFFNKNILFDSSFSGFIDNLPYSMFGFNFVRSFKPEFNSYLYVGFDRINSKDDINSYIVGLKSYLDEGENYYANISFNIAVHKSSSNERLWKLSFGGRF